MLILKWVEEGPRGDMTGHDRAGQCPGGSSLWAVHSVGGMLQCCVAQGWRLVLLQKGSMPCGIIHALPPADLRGLASVGPWDVLGVMGVLRSIAFSDNQLTLLAAVTSWTRKDVLWGEFVLSSGAGPFPTAWS